MISLILVFFAGVANVFMDLSSEDRFEKDYFNKSKSWKQKWKPSLLPAKSRWYYFGMTPKYEEKFLYSSTLFVSLTDFWHLMQFAMLVCFLLSIMVYQPIFNFDFELLEFFINFVMLRISFGLGFEPLYFNIKKMLDKINLK